MSDVFISYSHEDSDFVTLLQNKLQDAGLKVWRDAGGIGLGEEWRQEIDTAMQDTSMVLAVITPSAMQSRSVNYELAFARGAGIKIIPILLEKADRDPRLEVLQYSNFTDHSAQPWDALIKFLQRRKDLQVKGIPPTGYIHGYSGEWKILTKFSKWQDRPVTGTNKVEFEGSMFLLLSADGQSGYGTQIGELHISIASWSATYHVANRVTQAHIDQKGCLEISLKVLMRRRAQNDPPPPPPYRDNLFGDGEFTVTLHPDPTKDRVLVGEHNYPKGYTQDADETYTYKGFFGELSG